MKKGILIFCIVCLFLLNSIEVGAVEKKERLWQDETIYHIMIDRFKNGDSDNDTKVNVKDPKQYHGGDFQGIIEQLDYIKEMGFTAISLTPIFNNAERGYHGYWTTNFYEVEEQFGSIDDFKRLVDEAHARELKVIVEFVVSHISSDHPWIEDSEKIEWLHRSENDDRTYTLLNLQQPEVREYLTEAAKWWVEETDIDGYQLYSIRDISLDFIEYFANEITSVKDHFLLLGHIKSSENKQKYIEAGLNGVMNESLSEELRQAFRVPDESFATVLDILEEERYLYEMSTFMDYSDRSRFTHDIISFNEHPGPRWKQALTFLYSTPGIPIVYYGSEIALDGGEAPDNHRLMNFRTDRDLVEYIAKIGQIRSNFLSLTRGEMEVLHEKDGFIVFKRVYNDETTVVAINNTKQTQTVAIPASHLQDEMELRGRLNGDLVRSQNQQYIITMGRDESEIYVLSDRSGFNYAYLIALSTVLLLFGLFLFFVRQKSRKERN